MSEPARAQTIFFLLLEVLELSLALVSQFRKKSLRADVKESFAQDAQLGEQETSKYEGRDNAGDYPSFPECLDVVLAIFKSVFF